MRAVLAVLMSAAPMIAGAGTAEPLLACMRANLPETLRIQTVELTAYDRDGAARVMRGRVFATREEGRVRVMARIEQPHDLAGAAFLVRDAQDDAEMYMYLPAVRRVKRLAGPVMSGRLWNTDFSYNEFRRIQTGFAEGPVTLERAAEHAGRAVQVVRLDGIAGDADGYDSIRVLVDRKTCLPLRAEFRRGAALRKELSVAPASLRRLGQHWYAGELTLRDVLQGTRTTLRVLEVSSPPALSPRHFHPQTFHTMR